MVFKRVFYFVCLFALSAITNAQDITFTAQKLTVSGILSVSSFNDSAHIAGTLRTGGSDVLFIYDNKNVKTVPFLPGYDRVGGIRINNSGQAGGSFYSSDSETNPWVKGYFYSDGNLTGIGTLGGDHTQISGISNSGALSGYSSNGSSYHAVRYKNGTLTDLGTIAHNYSRGLSINNLDHVVGWSNVVPGENNIYHAFIYRNNEMEDIGTLPGHIRSNAVAVNDSDYVVGQSSGTSSSDAFVWYGAGSPAALPTLPGKSYSDVTDINNNNIIVGSCINNSGAIPAIWINGQVYNINDLIDPDDGVTLSAITLINNNNQIVGTRFNSTDGTSDIYILSPKNADFIVNTTGDESDFDLSDEVADVDPDTPGDQTTLRAAIQQANHNSGKNKIGFNIPGNSNPVISIHSALPPITEAVEINGLLPTQNKVEILGTDAGVSTNGIIIQANNCKVNGLTIHSFGGSGIDIRGNYNEIYDNIIGTDNNSTAGMGNRKNGISITGHHNTIGGTGTDELNVIAGNEESGIQITGSTAADNKIVSNYIGTDATGADDLGNSKAGIEITDAGTNNQIGTGLEKSATLKSGTGIASSINIGNIITKSLNSIIVQNTQHTRITGNIVGLFKSPDSDIYKALGSLQEGIKVKNCQSTVISNLILGAAGSDGIRISGAESTLNKIYDAIIGSDPNGSLGLGCMGSGIRIDSLASNNSLGGCDSLISLVNNLKYALEVINSKQNIIHGIQAGILKNLRINLARGEKSASVAGINIGNALGGLKFLNASNNIIGDSCAQNIIAANKGPGMIFSGQATILNQIRANLIGTDESGTEDLGNDGDGMLFMDGANKNMIGGNNPFDANVSVSNKGNGFAFLNTIGNQMNYNLSGLFGTPDAILKNLGNLNSGVLVKNSQQMNIHMGFFGGNKYGLRISGQNATLNRITGIMAGTDSLATQNIGNKLFGIFLDSLANNNILGGMGKDSSIVVGGNEKAGLYLLQAKRNQMFNMLSGIMKKSHDASMTIIKNLGPGVVMDDSEENQFGDPDMPNVVSGNSDVGILIKGAESSLNKIVSSFIGTSESGGTGLGNLLDGIKISEGALKNIIGGLNPGEEVISAGNGGSGFAITGQSTLGNSIIGCLSGVYKGPGTTTIPLSNRIGFYIENAKGTSILNSIFAANLKDGGVITGAGAEKNTVNECWFGTDSTFTPNLGNANGMSILNGAQLNALGNLSRNFFAGNKKWGLIINNADRNNVVNNVVGIVNNLQNPLKNLIGGIKVENSIGNMLGISPAGKDGLVRNLGNLVAGHDSAGIAILNSPNTKVVGNEITQNHVGMMVKLDSTLNSTLRRMIIIQNKMIQNLRAFEGTNTDVYLAGNSIVDNSGLATGIHLFNSTGIIKGNLITGDAGDGIAMEDGSSPVISKNNIYGNAGYGARNFDSSPIIDATQNWWGNATGPSGSGAGTGNKVSDGIDYSNWKTSMLSFAAFAEQDTILIPRGVMDTVDVYLTNFQMSPGKVEVSFSDEMNWIMDEPASSFDFTSDYTGAIISLPVMVPVGSQPNTVNQVVVASTSKSGSEFASSDTIYLSTYEPVITALSISVDTAVVSVGDTFQFVATGTDQEGRMFSVTNGWEANGGTINESGLFTAGMNAGYYMVSITDSETGLSDDAVVVVTESTLANRTELSAFKLFQNYPNPFSKHTSIKYRIPFESNTTIRIFTANGTIIQEIKSTQPSGENIVDWDATGFPAGMYFYSIEATEINGSHSLRDVKKMSVMKQ